jgi:serine/threonine-protein kinase
MSAASQHPLDKATAEHRLGPYRLIRPISAGGMARVYEGRLDSLAGVSTRVAIKVIHPEHAGDQAFQDLFISEARISARLDHQNLVRVQQFSREGELYYLVMELIDGLTLRKVISLCRRHNLQLPVPIIAEIGRQVCEGLEYAHQLKEENGDPLQLVHRDLKPSNLMLTTQGVVKLLDFGISYASEAVLRAPGTKSNPGTKSRSQGVKGTWGYMALEQVEGRRVGAPADIYGLAAVLFELATLEPLFEEKDNERLKERMLEDEAARRAARISQTDLSPILVRALQRDPAARYASAAAFGRALTRLISHPVTIRDDLIQLGQQFRVLESQLPTPGTPAVAASAVSSIAASLKAGKTAASGPIFLHPEDRAAALTGSKTANARSKIPPWLAWAGMGLLMSFVGAALAIWLIKLVDQPAIGPDSPSPVVIEATPPEAPQQAIPEPTPEPTPFPKPDEPRPKIPVNLPTPIPAPTPVPTPVILVVERPPAISVQPTSGEAYLTISAFPRAQVYINGVAVRYTPVFDRPLSPGSYEVELRTDDGRSKRFTVDLQAGEKVRKIWSFLENQWQ